ncbi:MAG: SDR family oxidoreductase [Bdellovibrionales bacterium]|nr:SDR family oxidoreductase [Bdellovibrionales bacterium]
MTILLTGATGYLGSALAEVLIADQPGAQVVSLTRRSHDYLAGSLEEVLSPEMNREVGEKTVLKVQPEVIIHCAAVASSAECERNQDEAYRVNTEFSWGLAEGAHSVGARMIHVSTDLVFEGATCPEGGFGESDLPDPVSIYAKSKLAAEEKVVETCSNAAICRICLLYGARRGTKVGPLGWMIHNFKSQRPVPLYFDEWRTPAFVDEVASALKALSLRQETGIFHLGGPERVSRVEFGRLVADRYGFSAGLIKEKSRHESESAGFRAEDVSLNSTLLCESVLQIFLSSPERGLSLFEIS